ncbi:unnamed protein product [Pleuronectes platessa]|uniref:Uncharacterized protein n=1 Tax=Pleuronectes platessa TaxID=8262 RepID=A0A9N7YXP1_PLEPL|nr:unnamed protein product [Pleuronectes platessa]
MPGLRPYGYGPPLQVYHQLWMFISCHLRATPKQNSQSHLNKACFFHRPTFRWYQQVLQAIQEDEETGSVIGP